MSLFCSIRHPRVPTLDATSARALLTSQLRQPASSPALFQAHFASNTPKSKRSAKHRTPPQGHAPPPQRRDVEPPVYKRAISADRKTASLLSRSSKDGKESRKPMSSKSPAKISVPTRASPLPSSPESKILKMTEELEDSAEKISKVVRWVRERQKRAFGGSSGDESTIIHIDATEKSVQRRIVANRSKVLWPGVWTFFALTGTCGALAYLDARFGGGASSGAFWPLERTQIPQSWVLTPSVIKEGVAAGWKELDNLTIGIVLAVIGVHFMKKSPLPFWEKLIHITGEKSAALCWFLPGVLYYLDHDYFQAAALLLSVPLITSYMLHFSFRFAHVSGIPLTMGLSGVSTAATGAFCMVYPDEKVWFPYVLIGRLDAKYFGSLLVLLQLATMLNTRAAGNRPAYLVHIASLGLGAAYVYFDGKDRLWKPLVARFARIEDAFVQSTQQ